MTFPLVVCHPVLSFMRQPFYKVIERIATSVIWHFDGNPIFYIANQMWFEHFKDGEKSFHSRASITSQFLEEMLR